MFVADSLESLDRHIKNDPAFPYSRTSVIPVVSTVAMAEELMDYLGEQVLAEADLAALEFGVRVPEGARQYWLAWKELSVFSPLLPEAVQMDIHRRTLTSQRAHHSPIELADDNPVGMPVGILIAEGTREQVEQHVAGCEVYPDTVVTFTELMQLGDARAHAQDELSRLRRSW